jgi:hypothetical protein
MSQSTCVTSFAPYIRKPKINTKNWPLPVEQRRRLKQTSSVPLLQQREAESKTQTKPQAHTQA